MALKCLYTFVHSGLCFFVLKTTDDASYFILTVSSQALMMAKCLLVTEICN